MSIKIEPFFHQATFTICYLLWCDVQKTAAIIDPPLDYNPVSGQVGTTVADQIINRINELDLTVSWLLETHAHADHLSAAQYLKQHVVKRQLAAISLLLSKHLNINSIWHQILPSMGGNSMCYLKMANNYHWAIS